VAVLLNDSTGYIKSIVLPRNQFKLKQGCSIQGIYGKWWWEQLIVLLKKKEK
jgi:hypothetical protein